jgi:hypothetical protein
MNEDPDLIGVLFSAAAELAAHSKENSRPKVHGNSAIATHSDRTTVWQRGKVGRSVGGGSGRRGCTSLDAWAIQPEQTEA